MIFYVVLIFILVAIDQASKFLMLSLLATEGATMPVLANFFHFTLSFNRGVVFGIASNEGLPLVFFLGTTALALVIFGTFLFKTDFKNKKLWVYHTGLAMMIAGTFGNFIDRVGRVDHTVVDFLDFRGIWDYIFNFADMCLMVGMGVFLFDQFILEPKRRKPLENGSGSAV